MGSMTTNGSVHTDTTVSNFYCDMDFNGEVISDAGTDASCEWTFSSRVLRGYDVCNVGLFLHLKYFGLLLQPTSSKIYKYKSEAR